MGVLNLIGNWLNGSGWVDVFKKAFINTPGRVESFLKGTNVKRSRYAHQLSLASLLRLARDTFDEKTENYDLCRVEEKPFSVFGVVNTDEL